MTTQPTPLNELLTLTRTLKIPVKEGLRWSSYSKEWFVTDVVQKLATLRTRAQGNRTVQAQVYRYMRDTKLDDKMYEAAQDPGRHPSDPWWDSARAVLSEYGALKQQVSPPG